ncbi:MAG: hypothetical protein KGO53_01595 [Alphaproteobacteria bacterium]|nr:hypothetical protein [Alphaproteobacteria bacterium]
MRHKRIAAFSCLCLLLVSGVAAAALPGPQRALAPGLFGLSEIAPGVFTDDVSEQQRWLGIKAHGEARVQAFFGELKAQPRFILCTHQECERRFGFTGVTAQTFGWHMIHLPPRALETPGLGFILMAHERTHAELHWRMGLGGLAYGSIPNWFDEGLASFVSRDARLDPFYVPEQRAWIRASRNFWDWGQFVKARGWRDAYGAAADNVRRLDEALGHEGLLAMINSAIGQGGFDEAFAKAEAANSSQF